MRYERTCKPVAVQCTPDGFALTVNVRLEIVSFGHMVFFSHMIEKVYMFVQKLLFLCENSADGSTCELKFRGIEFDPSLSQDFKF